MGSQRQLHFNIFLAGTGHHEASWRHPRSDPANAGTLAHYVALARTAERGRFDSVFLADGVAAFPDIRHSATRSFEPLTLLSALAAATEHIGLIGTVSTTFTEPYNLARYFSSLDHLSAGRAGWNIVTTAGDDAARNFNLDANREHDERYERAAEFLDVVRRRSSCRSRGRTATRGSSSAAGKSPAGTAGGRAPAGGLQRPALDPARTAGARDCLMGARSH
jgi:alkanesulfonate monooxygenase SsuD/methylene tetrahydromethanopterin reductase-like flavin-dependent oxidoreductase (luciferase family)